MSEGLAEWEKVRIREAFIRCWGLKSALIKEGDPLLRRGALETLAEQSGMRQERIKSSLDEILKM